MNRRILCPIAFCLLAALGCTDARFTKPKEVVPRGSDIRAPESRSSSLTRWEDVEPTPETVDEQILKMNRELRRDMDTLPKAEKNASADASAAGKKRN